MLEGHRRAFDAAQDEFLDYLSKKEWSKTDPMGCVMCVIVTQDGTETWYSFDIHEEQWISGRHYDDMARRKIIPMIRENMDLQTLLDHYPWKLLEGEARTAGGIRATDPENDVQIWVAFCGLQPREENVPLAHLFGEIYLRHLGRGT